MDEKECIRMVIHAVETDYIGRVEDIVGRLIDLFNSTESQEFLEEFLESKKLPARRGLSHLEGELQKSLKEGMKAMRQLVTDTQVHLWSSISAISAFQLNAQSLHFLLTRAADVLRNEKLSDKEKLKEIWNSTTQPSAQEKDRENAEKNLEDFLGKWHVANQNNPCRKALEEQIERDFKKGLDRQNSELEEIFDDIRAHFEGLKSKLLNAQSHIKTAKTAGTVISAGLAVVGMVGLTVLTGGMGGVVAGIGVGVAAGKGIDSATEGAIKSRAEERFLNRTDSRWYPLIESSLFDYIRGNVSDETLDQLIKDERLEEDLPDIREHIQRWMLSCLKLLEQVKISKMNKEACILEATRTWAFANALLFDDRENIQYHSELLSKLTKVALSSGDDVSPIISIARLPDGRQALKLKLIARADADMQAVDVRVRELARLAGGANVNRTKNFEYEIHFYNMDGLKSFLGVLAKHAGRLAEVHVRAAL